MVPAMTERERKAADVRRLEWLANATLGPAPSGHASTLAADEPRNRPAFPIGLWRRGLTTAHVLGQRFHLVEPAAAHSLGRRGTAPMR